MNLTRNGKIVRLPREVRQQLNRRLQDGEQGKKLVAWLNALPEVQAIAAAFQPPMSFSREATRQA